MEPKEFHISVILTVTTGRLLCDLMDLYEILSFMVGENLTTVALPRCGRECRPYLMELPLTGHIGKTVADIDTAHLTKENWEVWLSEVVKEWGAKHEVWPIHHEDHEVLHPFEDAKRINPDIECIEFNPNDNGGDEISPYGDINFSSN